MEGGALDDVVPMSKLELRLAGVLVRTVRSANFPDWYVTEVEWLRKPAGLATLTFYTRV